MFIELDFVERSATGKLILNVPILSMDEKKQFYELMGAYSDVLCTEFHDSFITMIKNPVMVPKTDTGRCAGFSAIHKYLLLLSKRLDL